MIDFKNTDFQKIDSELLAAIDQRLAVVSQMDPTERSFIYGLVRAFKPKKVLELGVYAGAASALVLDALKDDPEARLYSVDMLYNLTKIFINAPENKPVGHLVPEAFPELADRWTLYPGRRCHEVLDEIGGDFDCVILDTAHTLPGELLDFLLVLPYVAENCLFILHDVNHMILNNFSRDPSEINLSICCCRLLMNVVRADKISPKKLQPSFFNEETVKFQLRGLADTRLPNIGAFVVNQDTRDHLALEDVFNCLLMAWGHFISYRDMVEISQMLRRHYPEKMAGIFEMAYNYNFYLRNAVKLRSAVQEG